MNIALLIAGGVGSRMGADTPKQFLPIKGKPAIVYTLEAFERHSDIDEIAVVCLTGWEDKLRAYAEEFGITKLTLVAPGGANGQESIHNGIFALREDHADDDIILIHDANRPMVSHEIVSDCIATVHARGNAITAIPTAEAMLVTHDGISSREEVPRSSLRRTQTPHGFRLADICALHDEAAKAGITDSIASCALMIDLGHEVFFSKGSELNIKLTTPEDIRIFCALLAMKEDDRA